MEGRTVQTGFVAELLRRIRAGDPYGHYDAVSEEALLRPFLVTAEQRRALPLFGEPDAAALERLRAFHQAVAACLERETGTMVACLLDVNGEGFGRVLLFAGRLVLLDRTVRDAHRFGFASRERLAEEGERLIREGLAVLHRFPEVAVP